MKREEIIELIKLHFPMGKSPRTEQIDVLILMVEAFLSGKKHFIAEMPTGTGKSIVNYVFSKMVLDLDERYKRATICTKTKALQDQYMSDFADVAPLKSPKSFPCSNMNIPAGTRREVSAGDFHCKKALKENSNCKKDCEYLKRVEKYKGAGVKLANNALLLSCKKMQCQHISKQFFPGTPNTYSNCKEIVMIDECHNFHQDLIENISLTLNTNDISSMLERLEIEYITEGWISEIMENDEILRKYAPGVFDLNSVKNMFGKVFMESGISLSAKSVYMNEFNEVIKLAAVVNGLKTFLFNKMFDKEDGFSLKIENSSLFYLFNELRNIDSKLQLMKESKSKYVVYANQLLDKFDKVSGMEFIFKPLQANANKEFFNKSDFYVHLSATIGDFDSYVEELGIENYSTYRCKSPFPVENRKIYYTPCTNFNYHNQQQAIKDVAKMIDTIIEGNEGRCIVHTSSYYYAEQIKFSMKKSFDVFIPKNSRELNDIIDTNITLIGPTLYEGVDFYDERCRINILSKVQFPNLGDKYTKLKMNEVPGWYEQETLNKFIQAYGRGVRHLNDSAVFIILDSNFGKFLNSKYIPGWIKEAFQS